MLASGGMITNGEKCQYFSYNQILPILHIWMSNDQQLFICD
jgi:hypothetical protein